MRPRSGDGSCSETEEDLERERQKLMREMKKVRREMKREEIKQLKVKLYKEKQGNSCWILFR